MHPTQIALVVVGLVIRSLNKLMEVAATHGSGRAAAGLGTGVAAGGAWTAVRGLLGGGGGGSSMASGVALVALSALGYSLLGCLYEVGPRVITVYTYCRKWRSCSR